MKTLVVAEIGGKLVSLPFSDLAVSPVRGMVYFFGGQRYRVGEVLEYLGSHDIDGKPVSGNEKLLAILKDVYKNDATVAARMADLKSIGSDVPKDSRTSGGIIVPGTAAKLAFDNVVYIGWDSAVTRISIPAHSLVEDKASLATADIDAVPSVSLEGGTRLDGEADNGTAGV